MSGDLLRISNVFEKAAKWLELRMTKTKPHFFQMTLIKSFITDF